jgi:hypothetical protein
MVTLKECIDLSGLEEDAVEAIALHEHVPAIVAAELGRGWLGTSDGRRRIRGIIERELARAVAASDRRHADELRRTLSKYLHAAGDGA